MHHEYKTQQRATATFRDALLKSVPEGFLMGHDDYNFDQGYGAVTISLDGIITHLRDNHAQATAADMEEALRTLRQPYDGTRCEDFMGKHMVAHAVAQSCGHAFSDYENIHFLATALEVGDTPDGAYRRATFEWRIRHPILRDQKFKGPDGYASHMRLVALAVTAMPPAPTPTPGTAYGASTPQAIPPSRAAATKDDVLALQAQMDKLTAEFRTATAQRHQQPSRAPRPPRGPAPRYSEYCWTHGVGGHRSADCRNPAPGHKREATLANHLGGSSRRGN